MAGEWVELGGGVMEGMGEATMVSFLVGYMKMFSEICMYVASWSAIIEGGLFKKPPSVEPLNLKE